MGMTSVWQFAIKVAVTAVVIVAVAELGKRSSFWGAVLASIPLTSLLAFIWLYLDTGESTRVAGLSTSIFWLVLPSLVLLLALPALLRSGLSFWPSLGLASAATVAAYSGMVYLLERFDVQL